MEQFVREELLRLRDRIHNHSNKIQEILFRVSMLEQFRKEYEEVVDKLAEEEKIENAVKEALKKEHKFYLTNTQRIGALVLFAIAIADFLRTFNII